MTKNLVTRILNSSLDELIELKANSYGWPFPLTLYCSSLVAYLKFDEAGLEFLARTAIERLAQLKLDIETQGSPSADSATLKLVSLLIEIRLCIRQRNELKILVKKLDTLKAGDLVWQGEINFVKALAYGSLSDYEKEAFFFLEAHRIFSGEGAHRKSLLSLQNAIAAEASLHPERTMVVEYHHLLRRAQKYKVYSVAGLCALNISREYQVCGADLVALRLANLSIQYLRMDLGTQHFGLALCHRAQLLIELGRLQEAQLDLEESALYPFVEVKNARYFVEQLLKKKNPIHHLPSVPAWVDRKRNGEYLTPHSFGPLEQKLIHLLSQRPMEKNALLESLYKVELSNIDYESVCNRFKNLLARVRKKAPDLVTFDGRKYFLSRIGSREEMSHGT